MKVPRDIDLTLKRDFGREEHIASSSTISRNVIDDSYKRYNEYYDPGSVTTTIYDLSDWGLPDITSTTALKINRNIKKVEERICWRKLYKDPKIYEEAHTAEEWEDIYKNFNFALGSKEDRLLVKYKKLKMVEEDSYCECCGKHINLNNCLSHYYRLCQKCNERLDNYIYSIKL